MIYETREQNEQAQTGEENFADLLRMYEANIPEVRRGNIVHGQVIQFDHDNVVVDIGYKYEGRAPVSEFTDKNGHMAVNIGDEVVVLIEGTDSEGLPIVSKRGAEQVEQLNRLKEAYDHGQTISGTILRRVKGGFTADVGVEAFLPASQVDVAPVRNYDQWLRTHAEFKIVRFDRKTRNVVVSRRAAMEEELEGKRREMLEQIKAGDVVEGTVTNITDFGMFVDLGGLVGLVRRPDVAWGPSRHPSEHFRLGDTVKVKVLDVDKEKMRARLGIKQLSPNPWDVIENEYPVGAVIEGEVKSVTDFGIFIGILNGIDGLVHTSNLSWTKPIKPINELYRPGDRVQAMIMDVDRAKHQVTLGIKQITENPWPRLQARYRPGTKVRTKVVSVSDSGIIAELEEGIAGLIPKPELPRQLLSEEAEVQPGDLLEAEVLEVIPQEQKIRLSARRAAQTSAGQKLSTLGEVLKERLDESGEPQ